MPGKVLKDLYLYKDTDKLQTAAAALKENNLLSYKRLLTTAEKCYDEARLAESEGDEEKAYVLYFRACSAFAASKKAKDFNEKRDRPHWIEMGGKHLKVALEASESLFISLKRRYELRRELEAADQAEAMSQCARTEISSSKPSSQNGQSTVGARGDGAIDPNSNDGSGNGQTEKNTITPQELYQEIQKIASTVLILDTRDSNDYNSCRIKTPHSVNLPLSEHPNCYTAGQFEYHLAIGERTQFRQRHNYDHIVLVDARSDDAELAFQVGQPLRILSAALYEFDNRPTKRPPRMLVGGFESWFLLFPSWTTNPNDYKPPNTDFGIGNSGGYDNDSFSFPNFESFLAEPAAVPESVQLPSMPRIPDRSKKPTVSKSGLIDDGDYVQLHIPDPVKINAIDRSIGSGIMDETQKVFDESVSKHIDMRDHLESMKAKFRSVATGEDNDDTEPEKKSRQLDELLSKVEEKEAEIKRMQDVQRLRRLKPSVETIQARREAEDAHAKIALLEKEIDSLTRQLQKKEQNEYDRIDNEARNRLANVERLRQERKMRETVVTAELPNDRSKEIGIDNRMRVGIPGGARGVVEEVEDICQEGNMRRSHSSPYINRTPEEEESPVVSSVQPVVHNPPPQPQVPVPDRSTKPIPRDFNPDTMERLELEFYTVNIRRIQGPEGRVNPGLTGLKNLGNSCYMNSTVQCLSNIPPFASFFLHGQYRQLINYVSVLGSKGEVTRNFAVLLGAIWEGRFKYLIPFQFKACIGKVASVFSGYEQQDSQEFLAFLLDGLHEDLNQVKERRTIPEQNNDGLKDEEAAYRAWANHKRVHSSFIVDLFQGQYLSIVKCRVCHRESRTFDVFMYLSLPIPSDRKCRLEDCLQRYSAAEDMTGDCKWLCPYCNRKRDAVKKIMIWKLPKVLLIHLNRFSSNGRWREKLQTNVDFPTNRLDMSEYCQIPGSNYTLLGVSNHYGTMEGGHYTAYCKNAHDGRWYKYDDHEVSPISQGSVKSPAAYILYYIAEDYAMELQR